MKVEAKTATSNVQGRFTGDATGEINYATGVGKIIPNKLPQKGTVFSVIYNYGASIEQTKADVIPDSNQKLVFTIGTGSAIQPNSVELSIPVKSIDGSMSGSAILTDVPVNSTFGNLVNDRDQVQGIITYATGVVEVTPQSTTSKFVFDYTPMTVYGSA